jgi:C-terminal processing protease CtpA/Prc
MRIDGLIPLMKIFLAASALALTPACGGGGGSGGTSPPPPPPPAAAGPTWTQGVYAPAGTFANKCQVVRTGVDIEGNAFPDQAGSLLQEMFWQRSWTNETYLWPDEVTDRDPNTYTDRLVYFDTQKTIATTASGENKDDFHFSQPTEEYLTQRNSTALPGYGAAFAVFSSTPPRDIRIRYTEPGSPASEASLGQPKLVRGSRILQIDGIDAVNGATTQAEVDQLNRALSPQTVGEQHDFVVRDPGASTDRSITLAAANIAAKPVNRFSTIDTASGKVGYVLFNTFSPFASEKDIADAVTSLKASGINDLVLDLRYNGGGLLAVSSQLGYMVAGQARTQGKTFEQLRFNAAAGSRNPVTGAFNDPIPFYSTGLGFSLTDGQPLPRLDLPRVYILTTGRTCSASEALVNGLRGVDVDAVLIGDTTCGKPFGFYPTSNCGETYYSIQFQGLNNKGFGDYTDGFTPQNSPSIFAVKTPGCQVTDDFSRELGNTSEALLAAALQHRLDGSCPAVPVSSQSPQSVSVNKTTTPDGPPIEFPEPSLSETNRDMSMPRTNWSTGR